MLNEEQAAAVGFFFPADGAHQQQLPPMQPIVLGPQAIQAFPLLRADLQHNPTSEHFLQSTAPSAAAVGPARHQCSIPRCKRVAAEACGLCKTCCGQRGQGCTTRTHRTAPPSRKVHSASFTPTRPPAVLPPLISVSTSTQPTPTMTTTPLSIVEAGSRSFREDMPDEWAKEWNDREREARERREADELRKKNEQAMARQVVIQVWREVRPFPHLILVRSD